MSAQITDVARDLNVPAADIAALTGQLSGIDYDDTVDASREVQQGDVIKCADGALYANVYLTPAAIASLFEQFDGDRDLLAERYGIQAARPRSTPALERLAAYRVARERLHADVRAAAAQGASQAEIAEVSGLSRQWVAQILKERCAAGANPAT